MYIRIVFYEYDTSNKYIMYYGPERKNQRLKDYDYSSAGYYFVTFCTKNRIDFFGEIVDEKMVMNDYGGIINKNILETSTHFPNSDIDECVVMPNHIHVIVIIHEVGNADLRSLQEDWQQRTKMLLSKIIHGIKSSTTRNIRQNYGDYEFAWQKSFHDVIIRNQDQLDKTRGYIILNPSKWEEDSNNSINIKPGKK